MSVHECQSDPVRDKASILSASHEWMALRFGICDL